MFRHIIIAIHILLFSTSVFADEITFTGEAPGVVKTGERFRLVYKLNSQGGNPQLNLPESFMVLSGPNVSQSHSMQIINGRQKSSFNLTYTWIVMVDKPGKYNISPASVKVDGKIYKSNTVNIEVIKGQNQPQHQAQQSQNEKKAVQSAKDDLFVRVILNRNNIYQGEHVVATLKLYTRLNIAGFEDIKFPSFSGFFNQEIEMPSQISLQRENINGQIYQTGIIKKYVLFPQRSGKITIEPFELETVIRKRVRSNDPFDDFFGGRYKSYNVKAKSPEVALNVKALPKNAPFGYTGAVGNFKLETSVDRNKLKANESITLKIKISGQGNLKLIETPKLNFPTDFEVYEPKVKPSIRITESGAVGSLTYEYLIIPRHAGTFALDPFKFNYFNPALKSYKTLTGKPVTIEVEKGDEEESGVVVSNYSKQDITNIGSDIRFIHTGDLNLKKKNTFFFGSSLYYLLYLIGIFGTIIILLIRRKKIKENADQARMRTKHASKVSKKRLKLAAKKLNAGNDGAMYEAILKALWGYMADKLSMDAASLTRDNVGEILQTKKVDQQIIDDLLNVLDDCEFARYAPSATNLESKNVYQQAAEVIGKLERNIK